MKITWYGHAALSLEIGTYTVLVDPFLSDNPLSPIKPSQVKADYILVSHGHRDHIGDTLAISTRTNATVISNFEIARWLEAQGVKVHAQHIGGGFSHPFGYLKLTQAWHGSSLPDGSYGGCPSGFLLTTPELKKIYLAGDTSLFGDMRLIGEEGIDLAVLPIGDNYTMGPDDAMRAVQLLKPKLILPIHYNTWGIIAQDAHAWATRVQAETGAQVNVLQPGESLTL